MKTSFLLGGFLLLFSQAWSQQIAFPDANLRAALLNKFGDATLIAGTNIVDFSKLANGINGVTEVYANSQPPINSLSGLEQLPKLHSLQIQGNSGLLQFPVGFENLPLTTLDLSQNNLSSLPANFNMLTSLFSLIISDNKLTSLPNLPDSIFNLVVNNNNLTSLPDLLPTGLGYLHASNNNLKSIPPLPAFFDVLDAANNKLTSLPDLPSYVSTLLISHNQLSSLPTLPNGIVQIDVSNNSLTFEDLEPIISHFSLPNPWKNTYANQANFSITPATKNLTIGQTLNLTATGFIAGSVNNRYQWFKNGIAVSQVSASPAFTINSVAQADAGSYVCAVTNTVVTGLTISSDPVVVTTSVPLQQWSHYDKTNSPIGDVSKLTSISVGSDNNVWIAAGDTVYRRKADNSWVVYPVATTNGLVYASIISAGPNGAVWVGANDQSSKLSRFDGNAWQNVQVPQAVINPAQYIGFNDIEVTNNYVWIATWGWVLKFDGQTWTKLDYQNKITSPTSLSWDETKQELWISNNCGPTGNVFKYIPATDTWAEYQLEQSCAHAVQTINGGALVGSCGSSVAGIINGQVLPSATTQCVNLGAVTIDPASSNQAWFGTDANLYGPSTPSGLILFDGNSIGKSFNNLNSNMKGNAVKAIATQQKGNMITLWLITYLYHPGYSSKPFLETYTYDIGGITPQSITFNAIPVKKVNDAPFTLTATASSGLPITYTSSNPNVATISGDIVTIAGVGTTKITASQSGDNTYAAAPDQVQYLVVNPAPCDPIAKPNITANFTNPGAPLLTSSSVDGNQWFLNGNAINGETNKIFTVAQNGTYTVQVTQNSCVSAMSDGEIIVITEIDEKPVSSLYPNPAETEIRFTPFEVGPVSIQMFDVVGQAIKEFSYYSQGSEIIIDIRSLSSGTYILKFSQSGRYQNMHFIKK